MSAVPTLATAAGWRLSPVQERLCRVHRSRPGLELGAQASITIRGPIDTVALDDAVARVRARHEMLRARFSPRGDTAIALEDPNGLREGLDATVDLQHRGRGDAAIALAGTAPTELGRLRDLVHARAFTFVLVKLSAREHVLVITASALCGDAAAVVQVASEIQLECEYPGIGRGELLPYGDVAVWQRQLLEEPMPDDQEPYWKAAAFSNVPFPSLPFERRSAGHRDDGRALAYDTVGRECPASTSRGLRELAGASGPRLDAVLLAAWAIVLRRLSRTDDFLLGVRMDGRPQPELRSVVGPLARVLPLRMRVDDGSLFDSLVEATRRSLDLAHYDQLTFAGDPFGRPGPSERRHLFPLLFGTREHPPPGGDGAQVWTIASIVERLEPFDLALTASLGNEIGIELAWETSTFARADVELAAELYLTLLAEIAADANQRVSDFTGRAMSARTAAPRQAADEPAFHAAHEAMTAHAHRAPDRAAIVCGGEMLSYGALSRRASALARRLRALGATRGSIVAIVGDRSIDFFVGLFGVLDAGAAWLPIDPETPVERIEYMIRQAGAAAVLVQQGRTPGPGFGDLPVLPLGGWAEPDAHEDVPPPVHPRDLAYVIFTSGSTGLPKGVSIEHRQLSAYLRGFTAGVSVPDGARFAIVSTVAADLGHTSVFAALTSGGCLHVIPPALSFDADAFADYCRHHSVDVIKIVPAHLQALCAMLPTDTRLPWRVVVAGGEQLTWDVVDLVHGVAPDAAIVNEYGPTETTVGVVRAVADRGAEPFAGASVPLGLPYSGTTVHLLDERMRPVPVWVPGELYIGGDFVGRGYVGRSDQTAERFVPDPFSGDPGARMYRTGDLARRRSDDALEFLGRGDEQVKIRGYRVELGEVEAALCAHPAVAAAAANAAAAPKGGTQLVAWAAVRDPTVTADDLRRFVGGRLPPYMVPATIVCVDRLRLTANGKVDRRALPATVPTARALRRQPADEVEWSLAAVWQKVLNVEHVGVDDNYFSLGGDSLRVIQLVHEARRLGLTIAAADVLRHQTIRELRQAMQDRQRQGLFPDGIPPLAQPSPEAMRHVPPDVEDVYPATGIQRFMLEKYARNRGERGVFHTQESIWFSDESFSLPAIEQALRTVIDRHPALRTVFDLGSDPPMQWVRRGLRWTLAVEDISDLTPEAQDAWVLAALRADRERLFDAADRDTPLFRVAVFLRSRSGFDLALCAHHAIIDGWGHRQLTNQFCQAYADFKAGRTPDLGRPDTTQREFAALQEAVRRSDAASSFWHRYLDGVDDPVLPEPAVEQPDSDEPIVLTPLGVELVEALRAQARARGLSLQALFLGAWIDALRDWLRTEVVVTGVVTNGRSEHLSDPLGAVGLFWNIVPVVSRRALPALDQAAAVQNDLIDMQPYSTYPLPQIVADRGGREPFLSVFRYLHFWNVEKPPTASDLAMVDVVAYDRYSFPLDCAVLAHWRDKDAHLMLQYDPGVLSDDRAHAVVNRYRAALRRMAADGATADSGPLPVLP